MSYHLKNKTDMYYASEIYRVYLTVLLGNVCFVTDNVAH